MPYFEKDRGLQYVFIVTYRFGRCDASSQEVEPESQLLNLRLKRITSTKDDNVNAVWIPNEVIINDIVWFIAREFPQAQVTST